jgi:hypothetical protein
MEDADDEVVDDMISPREVSGDEREETMSLPGRGLLAPICQPDGVSVDGSTRDS